MDIGLVDLYTNGHHLPYAARTRQALDDLSDHDVQFITVSETPRSKELFDPNKIRFLEDPDSPPVEDRERSFDALAEDMIADFYSNDLHAEFDALHFLFADDILGPLFRHSPSTDGPRIVGELNGVFFERKLPLRQRCIHPAFLTLLKSPFGAVIDTAVPNHTDHEQLWRDLYIYRCLKNEIFDNVIVHSKEANAYVSNLDTAGRTPIKRIPYPAPVDFGANISKSEAREELGLPPDDSLLLFFGTLREEKGIHRLLRVLRNYSGPEFTMCIAGPPVNVTEQQVLSIQDESSVTIITELQYVDGPEVYFRAADGLILPYTREFGKECTSQTLEEASSSLLPVIVPNFGAVGRVTREWELGSTYTKGSDEALENAMRQFARSGVSHSQAQMKQYNRRHSYTQAVSALRTAYN
ncbi:glycosyltransferase [Halobacteriaceae archaeon SHR40]|uniref:glycosyltransferase n=1 Tax=Halovenus amylolytica TaxID=2500550 RepID=UPI000FE2A323